MPPTATSPTIPITTPAIHALFASFSLGGSVVGVGELGGTKVCDTIVEVPDEAGLAVSEADAEE